MQYLFTSLMIMMTTISMAQDGKAKTIKKTFSRSTEVDIQIQADPSIIWALLTNAEDFPRWNSTVLDIEGEIQTGNKIKLKSYLDPDRIFKIKIKDMIPNEKMIWGDAMGTRIFNITVDELGSRFHMYEKIGSIMFPLFAKKIPDFTESFERYAQDLKKEAEAIAKTQ